MHGQDAGVALVPDPHVEAAGFSGSARGEPLPEPLRDDDPWRLPRRVDGRVET